MICTHDTPGGARYCALCRHAVLAAAGQLTPRPDPDPTGRRHPMPPWFRDRVRRAREEAHRAPAPDYTQPTLED